MDKYDFTCPACHKTENRFVALCSVPYTGGLGDPRTRYHVRCMACNNAIVWSSEKHHAFIMGLSQEQWEYAGHAYSDYLLRLKGS